MLFNRQDQGLKPYLNKAKTILSLNWQGSYTRPSPGIYSHQWNRDSAFIAMGYARFDVYRGMMELNHLFKHQWENGMLPHIVFNKDHLGHYFPEPDFWQAPKGRLTSGITAPPLQATACLHLFEHAPDKEMATAFLKEAFPHLLASHKYLHITRDPEATGLAYIRHPWESGLENSPCWEEPLKNMGIDRAKLPSYKRTDLKQGALSEKIPSDHDYDRYVMLVDLFRKAAYDEREIQKECPFLVYDVLFNSILCKADQDLAEIARITGQDPAQPHQWAKMAKKAIREKMWSPEKNRFDSLCAKSSQKYAADTAALFMPLYARAASLDQAEIIYKFLNSVSCPPGSGDSLAIPNQDTAHLKPDSRAFWQGPVWLEINWLICQGLRAYGYKQKADAMRKDLIQLPLNFGFYENYDSKKGKGAGLGDFSCSAALFWDLVHDYYRKDPISAFNLDVKRLGTPLTLNKSQRKAPGEAGDPRAVEKIMNAMQLLKDEFFSEDHRRVNYPAMRHSSHYQAYVHLSSLLCNYHLGLIKEQHEKQAFWINLYNAIVIHGIVELHIENTVMEYSDFFRKLIYEIGGEGYSPDHIEHGILRANARPPNRLAPVLKPFDSRKQHSLAKVDPRIHFALVRGSRSSAPIDFYRAEEVDEQLELAAVNFVNSSEVVVLPASGKVMLSQIFKWYAKDFGGPDKVIEFIGTRLTDSEKKSYLLDRANRPTLEYLHYDWQLNR